MIYLKNKKTGEYLKNGASYVDYSKNKRIYSTVYTYNEDGEAVENKEYIGDTIYYDPNLFEPIEL